MKCEAHFDADSRATCAEPFGHDPNEHSDGYYLWRDNEAYWDNTGRSHWWQRRTLRRDPRLRFEEPAMRRLCAELGTSYEYWVSL